MIQFFIPCNPPKATKKNNKRLFIRNGRPMQITGEKGMEAESTWTDLLRPHAPSFALEGPLQFSVELLFPLVGDDTSTKAKKKAVEEGEGWFWHDRKPDASNLVECVQDVMTTLRFWKDDSQVVDLRVRKKRSKNPGVAIFITEAINP